MKKLTFTTTIKADKKKVWALMLQPSTYMIWTTPFTVGSYYDGGLEKGSKVKFLGPDGRGMLSEVVETKPFEFISFRHYGEMGANGVEDTTSDSVKAWAPAYENYTFTEKDGVTEVKVELDINEEWAKMFEDMWPKALVILKDICERNTLITVQAVVNAPIDKVWQLWSEPVHITKWAFASDDWHAPKATNDLKVGGKFVTTMAAKDGSVSFDFEGTYDMVEKNILMFYTMADGRKAYIFFQKLADDKTKVIEVFQMETENSEEMQRDGWQSIMNNFKKHAEL